jgi:phospholipase D1/2
MSSRPTPLFPSSGAPRVLLEGPVTVHYNSDGLLSSLFSSFEGGTEYWAVLTVTSLSLHDTQHSVTPVKVVMVRTVEESRSSVNTVKIVTDADQTIRMTLRDGAGKREWLETLRRVVRGRSGVGQQGNLPRDRTHVSFLINGQDYFAEVAVALNSAQEEILISGWFLTPELFLDRSLFPPDFDSRLETVLHRRAMMGVRVNVILFEEPPVVMSGLRSQRAKVHLESLHRNIRVMLLRPHMVSTYSHHMKFVVVDRAVAFVGGIDLCLGRYDEPNHPLSDANEETWIGSDYYNPDVAEVPGPKTAHGVYLDHLDRSTTPRMPWHDVMVSVDGFAAEDVASTFVSLWNFQIEMGYAVPDPINSHGLAPVPYMALPVRLSDPAGSSSTSGAGAGGSRHVASHLRTAVGGASSPRNSRPQAAAGSPASQLLLRARLTQPPSGASFSCANVACTSGHSSVTIVRSVGTWTGARGVDLSLLMAMVAIIEGSQHFLYLENQIFCTGAAGVENDIAVAIARRVGRAIEEYKKFRVFLVLNTHPEGNFFTSPTVRQVMQLQLESLRALVGRIEEKYPEANVWDYFSLVTLRAHGQLGPKLVTHRVYVHSKVMIADDRVALVGSANINDRSLLGDRDTEIGALITDMDLTPGTMDGRPFEVGRGVSLLRRQLMGHHLGIDASHRSLVDPVSDDFFHNRWCATASTNAHAFESAFPAEVPSSAIHLFQDLESAGKSGKAGEDALAVVVGFLCEFPLQFLCDEEDLSPQVHQPEFFVSRDSFK